MNYSHWEYDSYFNSVDVAIIGGGIVGLNAAIALKRQSPTLKVVLLEKGVVTMGASLRNAGFACFGSPTELLDDLQLHPEAEVFQLVERRYKGLLQLRANLGDNAIEYEPSGGYEVFDDEKSFEESKQALDRFNKALKNITGEKENYVVSDAKMTGFGFAGFSHLIESKGEGLINTGKMVRSLVQKATEVGVILINGVELKKFTEEENGIVLQTSWQDFKVKKLLFATNAYTSLLVKDIDVKPARAQVLITAPIKGLKVSGAFHYDKGFYYFRNVGQRLLLGGGRNLDFEGETTAELGITEKIQTRLEKLLAENILPNQPHQIERRWSGIMGMGDGGKSPIIKPLSANIFCAVRLGGMGVAIGTLVGQEAAAMVLAII